MNEKKSLHRSSGMHPSLLDVMCCLVFIFLLTSLLAATSQREASERTLPPIDLAEMEDSIGAEKKDESDIIVVTVRKGPEYLVNDTPLDIDQIPGILSERRPDEVEIRGDNTVAYGHIMDIMRLCRQAGIDRVALTYKIKENTDHGKH